MARFALRLPVIFRWGDDMNYVDAGFTKDIGRDEAFVVSGTCPPIGAHVRIEVLVPSPDFLPTALRIECIGKVTHVVREDGLSGFLFHGRFYDGNIREDYSWPLAESLKRQNSSGADEEPGDLASAEMGSGDLG